MPDQRAGDIAAPNLRPRTLAQRLAAGIVLIALLAAGALASWWILTDQADFGAPGRPVPPPAQEGAPF